MDARSERAPGSAGVNGDDERGAETREDEKRRAESGEGHS